MGGRFPAKKPNRATLSRGERVVMEGTRKERERDSPCLSGSADCDTRADTAGKVMEDMAATAPAAHIILLTHTHMWKFAFTKHGLLVRCCSIGGLRLVSTETFLVIYRQKYNLSVCSTQTTHTHTQTDLTMAQIRSRTRPAEGSGSPVQAEQYFYYPESSSAESGGVSEEKNSWGDLH